VHVCVCVCVNPQQLLASQAHTVFHYTFTSLSVPVPICITHIPQGSNPGMCAEKPATKYMAWPIPCLIIQMYSWGHIFGPYWLLLHMKALLMGYGLQLLEVEEETRAKVAGKGLQKCFQEWYSQWQTPVTTERNYVEGSVQ